MADGSVIVATLEEVATRDSDPSALVYRELFRSRPELEALFVLDRSGHVRGSMFQQCVECILDHVDGGTVAPGLIGAERLRHEDYGVDRDVFHSFFEAVRDTFRALLGERWSEDMDREWNALLVELRGLG